MYEIQAHQAGGWVPDSLFEDLRPATFEAKRRDGALGDASVRVVEEGNETGQPDRNRETFYMSGKMARAVGRKSFIRRRKVLAGRHIVGLGGLVTVLAGVAVVVLVF